MDFEKLVEAALFESPDRATCEVSPGETYNMMTHDDNAYPFLIDEFTTPVDNCEQKHIALFVSTEEGITHEDLHEMITAGEEVTIWPPAMAFLDKQALKIKNDRDAEYIEPIENCLLSGRFWVFGPGELDQEDMRERVYISFWEYWTHADKTLYREYILPFLADTFSNNAKIFVQYPTMEDDEWITQEEFLKKPERKNISNPQINKLKGEVKELIPKLHAATGNIKEKLRVQIRVLQKKIMRLGGEVEDIDSVVDAGNQKVADISGNQTLAQIRSRQQTSESFVTLPINKR